VGLYRSKELTVRTALTMATFIITDESLEGRSLGVGSVSGHGFSRAEMRLDNAALAAETAQGLKPGSRALFSAAWLKPCPDTVISPGPSHELGLRSFWVRPL
jgi:hypothetical protein